MEFLDISVVLSVHDAQLAQHGGLAGVRDPGVLDSALARPRQAESYGVDDMFVPAASFAFDIARNHPLLDGNKRTAWVCARTFLKLNGAALTPDRGAAVEMMVQLAEGSLGEEDFAVWLGAQRKSTG
ncbi:MAG: type II toxin-antitoxin system death-on-curing family toxin [Panacagrimonas sp.]